MPDHKLVGIPDIAGGIATSYMQHLKDKNIYVFTEE